MKKGLVARGSLGLCLVAGLSIALSLSLAQPVSAQGAGGKLMGIVSDPLEMANDPGHRYQASVYSFARGNVSVSAETTFDVIFDTMGPGGVRTSYRRTATIPHNLDPRGRVTRLTLVQTADNFNLLVDGVVVDTDVFEPPPLGSTIFYFITNCHTSAEARGQQGMILGGSVQINDSAGKLVVAQKKHELTGNVILMK